MKEMQEIGGMDGLVDEAVLVLLKKAPGKWRELNSDSLTAVEQKALFLLTAVGLIERRFSIRLSLVGHEVRIEVTAVATGEYGLAGAMEPALAKAWHAWADLYSEHRGSGEESAPTFFCEQTAPGMWRLTDQGALALQNLGAGDSKVVLDFVFKRTVVFRDRIVPGYGKAERIEEVTDTSAPCKVEVTNLEQLSVPMAHFAKMIEAHFAKQAASEPTESTSSRRRGRPEVKAKQAEERREIVEKWDQAKQAEVSREQFCQDEGISFGDLKRCQDWVRQRGNRGQE